MFLVDWLSNEDNGADIRVQHQKAVVTVHIISEQGTLFLRLSPREAKELGEKLLGGSQE